MPFKKCFTKLSNCIENRNQIRKWRRDNHFKPIILVNSTIEFVNNRFHLVLLKSEIYPNPSLGFHERYLQPPKPNGIIPNTLSVNVMTSETIKLR